MMPITVPKRRPLYDVRCEELAEHFLANNPRCKTMTPATFAFNVQCLAEEILAAIENYDLPEPPEDNHVR